MEGSGLSRELIRLSWPSPVSTTGVRERIGMVGATLRLRESGGESCSGGDIAGRSPQSVSGMSRADASLLEGDVENPDTDREL